MTTIISGNTPSTIGNDTTISGDITANNLPANGSIVGYQQGGWTPVPSQGSIDAVLAPTRWVWSRIGNTVTVSAFISNFTDTSSSVIELGGIPYSATNVVSGPASSSRIATTVGGVTLCYLRGGIDDMIQFLCTTDSKTNPWVQPKYSDATAANNSTYFTVTYLTDDTTWTPQNGATVS